MSTTQVTPWWRRAKARVIAGAVAAAGIAGGAAISALATNGTNAAVKLAGQTLHVDVKTASGPALNVEVAQGMGCEGNGWVYPRAPSSPLMRTPPGTGKRVGGKTWDQSPASFGAVPAGPVDIYVTATGKSGRAVVLKGMRFHIEKKEEPVRGTRVVLGSGCGDGATYHAGAVSFAKAAPYWVPVDQLPPYLRTDPLRFPYTVTASDPSLLLVSVHPDGCSCQWRVKIDWIDGTSAGTTTIDDHGKPFHTTSSTSVPAFTWEGARRVPAVSPVA